MTGEHGRDLGRFTGCYGDNWAGIKKPKSIQDVANTCGGPTQPVLSISPMTLFRA
jgi:hypothetical protein